MIRDNDSDHGTAGGPDRGTLAVIRYLLGRVAGFRAPRGDRRTSGTGIRGRDALSGSENTSDDGSTTAENDEARAEPGGFRPEPGSTPSAPGSVRRDPDDAIPERDTGDPGRADDGRGTPGDRSPAGGGVTLGAGGGESGTPPTAVRVVDDGLEATVDLREADATELSVGVAGASAPHSLVVADRGRVIARVPLGSDELELVEVIENNGVLTIRLRRSETSGR